MALARRVRRVRSALCVFTLAISAKAKFSSAWSGEVARKPLGFATGADGLNGDRNLPSERVNWVTRAELRMRDLQYRRAR